LNWHGPKNKKRDSVKIKGKNACIFEFTALQETGTIDLETVNKKKHMKPRRNMIELYRLLQRSSMSGPAILGRDRTRRAALPGANTWWYRRRPIRRADATGQTFNKGWN
jgi:hypothetical protein